MRVLLVAEPMLGLDAATTAGTTAEAWRRAAPHVQVDAIPLGCREGTWEPLVVPDPWGRPTAAGLTRTGSCARLHTLDAAGPRTARPGDDPVAATSAGVGALVAAALASGASEIVVPLDDLACHDAGAGLVGALAGRDDADPATLTAADVTRARATVGQARLVGRYEDDVPLLGLGGASATQAPAKGMDPQAAQDAERSLGELADRLRRELPEPTDLLSGAAVRRDRQPGAGAGGGLGYGVLLLGGRLERTAAALVREHALADRLASADLVVATTDLFDWRVLRSSVVAELARLAAPSATPVVLLTGRAEAGRREGMSLGIAGLYEVLEEPRRCAALLADPAAALAARTTRVARTWCPPPRSLGEQSRQPTS